MLSDHGLSGDIQYSPIITLCLGYIGMEHVISEPRYKGTTLQRNKRNFMVIFSYNSLI